MDLTPDELDELLALAGLGALDPDDERSLNGIDLDVASTAGARAAAFERTVAALDHGDAVAPPAALRRRVLDAAVARRSKGTASSVATLFTNQVAALAELVASLDEDDWRRPAPPYDWTVHGLLAHLLVIENYTARQLGLTADGPAEAAHLEMGAGERAAQLRGMPSDTARRWHVRASANAAALADPAALPGELALHGWPFSLDGAMIARAFEVWTHAEDIRRATGRPMVAADPADLRTMSTFSVQALPLTLPLVEPTRPLTPTRVVLTGEGGGTFELGGDGAPFSTLLVADVTDYCRVVARRIAPDALGCHIEGDTALAQALLSSAGVFAV